MSASPFPPDKLPDALLGVPKGQMSNGPSDQTAISPSSPGCALTPKFVAVEPIQIAFNLNQKHSYATIKITSMNPGRIAWRIRTNAPTRYVVMPTSGFLTVNGSVIARITLAESHKYHHRHRFMVQAMEAKEGEKDRKKIWNDERADKLDLVQCVRITTSESVLSQTANGSPKGTTSTPSSQTPTSVANAPNTSASTTATSESTSTSMIEKESGLSSSSLSDSEYAKKIEELTTKVKMAMNEKAKESQKLIEVVNEVKKIEVELDRTGAQCKHLNEKVAYEEAQCKTLQERCAQITNQIRMIRSGSR